MAKLRLTAAFAAVSVAASCGTRLRLRLKMQLSQRLLQLLYFHLEFMDLLLLKMQLLLLAPL